MPRVAKQDPLKGFKFRVSIPGVPGSCGFKKISGLDREVGVITYEEGGYDTIHRLKGKAKTGELVCEKGCFPNKDLENYFKKTLTSENYRGTVKVELLTDAGKVGRTWTLSEAWCSKWSIGDIDASSEDVIVETITIQYEDFI